ncbi:PREDICTED: uncharacterized protein LOC104602364 isoform X1 [Nelumbo nucifera]|uniref:Uncharacterized protein LOC104602364 isoform X1 n=1 Tax=Nelumbo nucifera TaxID=4432 RepID=A0A1U8Q7S5_NELNU|nr:PREDICTED: uncharacterized protein LOC104602364 isoform X1 [Nelumbo nucifera]
MRFQKNLFAKDVENTARSISSKVTMGAGHHRDNASFLGIEPAVVPSHLCNQVRDGRSQNLSKGSKIAFLFFSNRGSINYYFKEREELKSWSPLFFVFLVVARQFLQESLFPLIHSCALSLLHGSVGSGTRCTVAN